MTYKHNTTQHNTTQHNTTQHNTTCCEAILVLNPKTNLLFLLVSFFSFISWFFATPTKNQSYSFNHILQNSFSEIENNNIKNIYNSVINSINNNLKIIKNILLNAKRIILINFYNINYR